MSSRSRLEPAQTTFRDIGLMPSHGIASCSPTQAVREMITTSPPCWPVRITVETPNVSVSPIDLVSSSWTTEIKTNSS